MGGFFAEVYIVIYNGSILMMILVMYILAGYVMIKSLNGVGDGLFYIPFLVLYLLMV